MIRAAVFDGPGRPFRLEQTARPGLQPGEAWVRVAACTICGSDLHTFAGRRAGPTPCVLGHEVVGVVEEVAGEVRDLTGELIRPGDRVTWALTVSCGECFYCKRGLTQKCERLRKYGHELHDPGFGPLGGLATHCRLLPRTPVLKLPPAEAIPDFVVAPAACATATARAACEAVGALDGTRPGWVAVFGVGMVGLAACALAAEAGHAVIVCDPDDYRLSLAQRFGAAYAVTPQQLTDQVCYLTAGRGIDFALEACGSSAAACTSLDVLRVGGVAAWVGCVLPCGSVPVRPEMVVRRCLRLVGVHNYAARHLVEAVAFLARCHTRYPFSRLVGRTFPLEAVDDAFSYAERLRPVRVAVVPT